jgi:hypothetical protein
MAPSKLIEIEALLNGNKMVIIDNKIEVKEKDTIEQVKRNFFKLINLMFIISVDLIIFLL